MFTKLSSLLIIGAILLTGCGLPIERPKDLIIMMDFSTGGMTPNPFSSTTIISEKESSYRSTQKDNTIRKKFTVTSAELDTLYQVFRTNNFDKITIVPELIYDAGGSSTTLSWNAGANIINKGDSGTGSVSENGRSSYENIQTFITNFVNKKIQ